MNNKTLGSILLIVAAVLALLMIACVLVAANDSLPFGLWTTRHTPAVWRVLAGASVFLLLGGAVALADRGAEKIRGRGIV